MKYNSVRKNHHLKNVKDDLERRKKEGTLPPGARTKKGRDKKIQLWSK